MICLRCDFHIPVPKHTNGFPEHVGEPVPGTPFPCIPPVNRFIYIPLQVLLGNIVIYPEYHALELSPESFYNVC